MCRFNPADEEVRGSKKQVRFEDDKLEERFELELFEEDEPSVRWMTRADFRAIRCDICRAVQDCNFGSRSYVDDEGDDCFRGLEGIVSSRKVQVQAFVQDLLEIQEDYRAYGLSFSDSSDLQMFSENHSKSARERARILADRDAMEARRVYAESMEGSERSQ